MSDNTKKNKSTTLTIVINHPLNDLKKAYAKFHGEKDWRKVKKSDIAGWAGDMAQADIDQDIANALE